MPGSMAAVFQSKSKSDQSFAKSREVFELACVDRVVDLFDHFIEPAARGIVTDLTIPIIVFPFVQPADEFPALGKTEFVNLGFDLLNCAHRHLLYPRYVPEPPFAWYRQIA